MLADNLEKSAGLFQLSVLKKAGRVLLPTLVSCYLPPLPVFGVPTLQERKKMRKPNVAEIALLAVICGFCTAVLFAQNRGGPPPEYIRHSMPNGGVLFLPPDHVDLGIYVDDNGGDGYPLEFWEWDQSEWQESCRLVYIYYWPGELVPHLPVWILGDATYVNVSNWVGDPVVVGRTTAAAPPKRTLLRNLPGWVEIRFYPGTPPQVILE